ncbi:hypothetical protein ABQF26_11845, partial [Mycolicibacterium elephantis]
MPVPSVDVVSVVSEVESVVVVESSAVVVSVVGSLESDSSVGSFVAVGLEGASSAVLSADAVGSAVSVG